LLNKVMKSLKKSAASIKDSIQAGLLYKSFDFMKGSLDFMKDLTPSIKDVTTSTTSSVLEKMGEPLKTVWSYLNPVEPAKKIGEYLNPAEPARKTWKYMMSLWGKIF